MALQFGDAHYCKVTHFENQKAVTRRVTCIEVHRTDGRVVRLRGADLPDSICIQTGPESDSDGKGFLQVIELPEGGSGRRSGHLHGHGPADHA